MEIVSIYWCFKSHETGGIRSGGLTEKSQKTEPLTLEGVWREKGENQPSKERVPRRRE